MEAASPAPPGRAERGWYDMGFVWDRGGFVERAGEDTLRDTLGLGMKGEGQGFDRVSKYEEGAWVEVVGRRRRL